MLVVEVKRLINSAVASAQAREIQESHNSGHRLALLMTLLEKAEMERDIASGGIRISLDDDELIVRPSGMLELICTKSGDSNSYNPEGAKAALCAPQTTELPEFFDAVLNAGPNEIEIGLILI